MTSCLGVPYDSFDDDGSVRDCDGCAPSKRPKQQRGGGAVTSDSLLAGEMNKLTFEEREKVYAELHGVDEFDHSKVETPEFIAQKIQETQYAVAKLAQHRRREYDRAMFLNPGLKNDPAFFLLFLRTEHYDVRLAAKRICTHFTDKVALWGEDKVARRITLDDFDDGDFYALRGGVMRFLENKDRSGRLILLRRTDRVRYHEWKNHVRPQ